MSTSSPAPASLASVVDIRKHHLNEWNRLDDSEPLAQLRAKFWGTGMQEDEQWRDEELLTSDESDPTESDDDDLKPCCHVLDIDNKSVTRMKTIWVRTEYIRIYNYLLNLYENNTSVLPPAAVITGQPGVGKSVFLYYALCRCLAEKRPIIWRLNKIYYIFVEDGVYEMGEHFTAANYKSLVWTLVDSDESKNGVPEVLVTQNTPFFVIYASSPASDRWSHMDKTCHRVVIVMNPWTRSGIRQAASMHLNRPGSETIDDMYDRFGPTPRLCIQKPLDTDQLEEYKNETRRALANLTLQSLRELTNDIEDLKMDLVSHKLCLISREKLHNVRSSFHITPITTHMQSRLAIRMRNQDIQRLVEMYQDFDRHPFSKGLSGHLFENIGHLYFQKRIIIEYASMTRLSSNGQKNHPQWHSSHPIHNEEDSELKKLRQDAWDSRTVLDVTPTDIQEYGDQEFRELDPKPNIYYIPKMKNEEALDSFIWYDNYLYIFQFTVSKKHDIKPGFISRFTACNKFPQSDKWRFVFIIPDSDGQILKCPYFQIPELPDFKPFSAQVAMDGYAKLVVGSMESNLQQPVERGEESERASPVKMRLRSAGRSNDGEGSKPKGSAKAKGKQRQR